MKSIFALSSYGIRVYFKTKKSQEEAFKSPFYVFSFWCVEWFKIERIFKVSNSISVASNLPFMNGRCSKTEILGIIVYFY